MSEQTKECSTCALLVSLRENGIYYAEKRQERKNQSITMCKAVVVTENYYNVDGKMEYGGRAAYNPRPLNFCSECGRKLNQDELTW